MSLELFYINPNFLVGGAMKLDSERAGRALDEQVCKRLNISRLEAAHGIHTIASSNMLRAVKAVSTFRGRDPRDFTLFAFGGNGPVVAMEIARELEMPRLLVPPNPGVFSALGLLCSDPEHEAQKTLFRPLDNEGITDIANAFELALDNANGEIINVGNNSEPISIKELALKIIKLTNSKSKLKFLPFEESKRNRNEIMKRMPDIEKAKSRLGYVPKISLEDGILKVVNKINSN